MTARRLGRYIAVLMAAMRCGRACRGGVGDDGIVGVHGCGEVASGRRLGGSHHRRPLHLLILMLLLMLRARCVWRMHVGGC